MISAIAQAPSITSSPPRSTSARSAALGSIQASVCDGGDPSNRESGDAAEVAGAVQASVATAAAVLGSSRSLTSPVPRSAPNARSSAWPSEGARKALRTASDGTAVSAVPRCGRTRAETPAEQGTRTPSLQISAQVVLGLDPHCRSEGWGFESLCLTRGVLRPGEQLHAARCSEQRAVECTLQHAHVRWCTRVGRNVASDPRRCRSNLFPATRSQTDGSRTSIANLGTTNKLGDRNMKRNGYERMRHEP